MSSSRRAGLIPSRCSLRSRLIRVLTSPRLAEDDEAGTQHSTQHPPLLSLASSALASSCPRSARRMTRKLPCREGIKELYRSGVAVDPRSRDVDEPNEGSCVSAVSV
jgi:hypothetical protein